MAVFMLMDVVLIMLLRRMASTPVSTWAELNPGHSHWLSACYWFVLTAPRVDHPSVHTYWKPRDLTTVLNIATKIPQIVKCVRGHTNSPGLLTSPDMPQPLVFWCSVFIVGTTHYTRWYTNWKGTHKQNTKILIHINQKMSHIDAQFKSLVLL